VVEDDRGIDTAWMCKLEGSKIGDERVTDEDRIGILDQGEKVLLNIRQTDFD
jgi:hypothetical protein